MIHQLTEKYCETVARRCKSVAEFFKRYHSAANKALKEGWYDSYTWLSRERVNYPPPKGSELRFLPSSPSLA